MIPAQHRAARYRINKRTSHVTLVRGGERIKGGGTVLWDRKLIPTACAWASSRTGTPVGMPRTTKVGDLIVEDYNIRKFLKKTLYGAGVPKIEIERYNDVVTAVHALRASGHGHRQGRR